MIGGMSNGVEQAVNDIVRSSRNVFLLRFHGHGAPGTASVSSGHGELDPNMIHRADITLSNLAIIRPIIARLRPIFGPYGCVQFMHCETGGGRDGRQLLQAIANELHVPVSAGINTQFGKGLRLISLKDWCRALPDFPGFTPS